jgi:uncharacterized protein YjbI with pentapeptide repeats
MSSAPGGQSDKKQHHEPQWWIRDVLVAGTVGIIAGLASGAVLMAGQNDIDERRAQREQTQADERRLDDLRLEDLRFIREQAADRSRQTAAAVEDLTRLPYAHMDLRGMNLSGLDLRKADFTDADLSGADLSHANLQWADLTRTNLQYAILVDANLDGAKLLDADFSGASTDTVWYRAILDGADVRDVSKPPEQPVCYNGRTQWPEGYDPPPNSCRP